MKKYFKNIKVALEDVQHVPLFDAIEVKLGEGKKEEFTPVVTGDHLTGVTTKLIYLACKINDELDAIAGIRQMAMINPESTKQYDFSITYYNERHGFNCTVHSKMGYVTHVSSS